MTAVLVAGEQQGSLRAAGWCCGLGFSRDEEFVRRKTMVEPVVTQAAKLGCNLLFR